MGGIVVKGLGKAYKQYPSRWARFFEWITPGGRPHHQLRWILKDVNFSIRAGEAVGIIGVNGAGKSTLLKMITGTTQATEGSIEIVGTVAALLELGMGFHPDFTGRQNVIMTGQLLGMSIAEILNLMPEIESFAEIGDAIDYPLRTYSSGMQVRLAFSVATARRPDILIVDEALSVGDAYFQHKSFERIRAFRESGTTLLLVSHDRTAIQSICDRAILLEYGRLAKMDIPEVVLDYYHATMAEKESETIRQTKLSDGSVQTISGSGEATISEVLLLDVNGKSVEAVQVGAEVVLQVRVAVNRNIDRLVLGFMIKDRFGQAMYGINTHRLDRPVANLQSGDEVIYRFAFPMRLGQGNYSVSLSLSRFDSHLDKNYEWRDYALIFHVINTRQENFVGCTWLDAKVDIQSSPPNSLHHAHSHGGV